MTHIRFFKKIWKKGVSILLPFNKKPSTLSAIALLCLLVFFLGVRIISLRYPIDNAESSRDYLVARHIVVYHESTAYGPYNSVLGNGANSPLYIYILAAFLYIKDSLLFLNFINAVLQVFAAWCLFQLGFLLFDELTAFAAAFLYLSSMVVFIHSFSVWQPYLMEPFLIASFLFLAASYNLRRFDLLILGEVVFCLAIALHFSTLGIIPLFLVGVLYVAKKQQYSAKRWLSLAITPLITLVILFIGPLANLKNFLSLPSAGLEHFSFRPFFVYKQFILSLFNWSHNIDFMSLFLATLLIFLQIVTLFFSTNLKRKLTTAVLGCGICSFLFILALIPSKTALPPHYFIPIYGLFFLYLAALINVPIKAYPRAVCILRISIFALVVLAFSWSLYVYAISGKNFYNDAREVDAATKSITREIFSVEQKEKISHPDFFTVQVYEQSPASLGAFLINSGLFTANLEKMLNYKITQIDEISSDGFRYITSHRYLFLVCQYDYQNTGSDSACISKFSSAKNNTEMHYVIIKQIYDKFPFSIYLFSNSSL